VPVLSIQTRALLVCSIAVFVDTLLYYMIVPLVPELAERISLSQFQVGALFGSYALCLIGGTYVAGRMHFRSGQRLVMMTAIFALGVATLLFATSENFVVLVAARCVQGIAAAFTWVLGLALVMTYYPEAKRGVALGIAVSVANAGYLLGPPVGGLLGERLGYSAPFILGVFLVVIDGFARYFLLPETQARKEEYDITWRSLLSDPAVKLLAYSSALVGATYAMLDVALPLRLHDAFLASPQEIGLVFAALAITFVVSSPPIGKLSDRFGYLRVLGVGYLLVALILVAPLLVSNLWQMGAVLVFVGLFSNFVFAPCQPGMAKVIDARGSVHYAVGVSLLSVSYSIGMMVGAYAGSLIVEYFGFEFAIIGTVALYVVGGAWGGLLVRSGAQRPL
jgi:DHA1 family solute carrier family 18 vesicular amine transporter 1/2